MAFNPGKKNDRSEIDEYRPEEPGTQSFLGQTIKIKGEITCDEFLIIEGEVKGNIKINNTLTIGRDGYVKGEIDAKEVKIIGKAEGNITATDKLEISSQGHFSGTIKSDKLVIEEGAVFKGKANLDEEPRK